MLPYICVELADYAGKLPNLPLSMTYQLIRSIEYKNQVVKAWESQLLPEAPVAPALGVQPVHTIKLFYCYARDDAATGQSLKTLRELEEREA